MERVILLCNGSLSTGILVKKMRTAAEAQDFACEVSAAPVSDTEAVGAEVDLILSDPQVRFQIKAVKKQVACPVTNIDPMSYDTMNGEKVLDQIERELGKARQRIWS